MNFGYKLQKIGNNQHENIYTVRVYIEKNTIKFLITKKI